MISNTLTYPPITLPLELRIKFLWNRLVRFAALSEDEEVDSTYELEREFKELIATENATISRIYIRNCDAGECICAILAMAWHWENRSSYHVDNPGFNNG